MAKKNLKNVSIAQLEAELIRRKKAIPALHKKRAKLVKALAEVEKAIAAIGDSADATGVPAKKKVKKKKAVKKVAKKKAVKKTVKKKVAKKKVAIVGRKNFGKNKNPLSHYIKLVLTGQDKPMRVKDVEAAVKKEGYKSTSKHFYSSVAITLRDKEFFVKVGHGRYKLKPGVSVK